VAVKSIARTYHWAPSQIMELFYDEIDMYGLFYWYEDAKQMAKELNK
jgi:hypothetical protein